MKLEQRLYSVALVALRSQQQEQGHLLAVEEIAPATLADWSALTRASVTVPAGAAAGTWELTRDIGDGTLRVEVSGHAERQTLANARRHLITSGVVALLTGRSSICQIVKP